MTATLVVDATTNAVARRWNVTGRVVQADRGSQFRSKAFQEVPTGHGLILSMGRLASVVDDAAMESFHSLLPGKVLDRRAWDTPDQLRQTIVTWIEKKYDRRRRQDGLSRLTR